MSLYSLILPKEINSSLRFHFPSLCHDVPHGWLVHSARKFKLVPAEGAAQLHVYIPIQVFHAQTFTSVFSLFMYFFQALLLHDS